MTTLENRPNTALLQHSSEQLARGSDDWRIVPELNPGDAEPVVEKTFGDSFVPVETRDVDLRATS